MSPQAPRARPPDACPDAEQLAAYIDGMLDPAERTQIEAHLVSCADCRDIVGDTVAAQPAPTAATPRRTWRTVVLAGGLLAAAAALVLAVRLKDRDATDADLGALVRAAGTHRSVEPRLSGGFAYGVLSGERRSTSGPEVEPDVRIAAARIEKRVRTARSADALHAQGAARLLLGDTSAAIAAMTEASRLRPDADAIAGDLAAALLVRGAEEDRPDDFARALEILDRSHGSAATAESLFNRALALERLKLRDQAREAWRAYLARDTVSGWADEARRHLDALAPGGATWQHAKPDLLRALDRGDQKRADAITRAFPAPVREHLEDDLLPSWASACRAACNEATRQRAFMLAGALATAGDSYDLDTMQRLTPATAAVTGLVAYGAARRSFKANDFVRATEEFTRAAHALESAGLPLSYQASFYVHTMAYRRGDLAGATAGLRGLAARASRHSYVAVEARCEWVLGLIALAMGHHTQATQAYVRSLSLFERIGDSQDMGNVHVLMAEALDLLGQPGAAWRERVAGLSLLDPSADVRRWTAALLGAALAAQQEDAPRAAVAFATAAIDAAGPAGNRSDVAEAQLYRAASALESGDRRGALRDAREARDAAGQIRDRWLAARLHAEADAVEGRILVTTSPAEGIERLTAALTYFEGVGARSRTADISLALGLGESARGATAEAERYFVRGIDAFEQIRGGLASDELRISFFDQGWRLFDEMIRLTLARGSPDRAFGYAERSRARALLDSWRPTATSRPRTPADLAVRLPSGTTLVSFYRTGDSLSAWVTKRERQDFVRIDFPAEADRELAGFIESLERGDTTEAGAALYERIWTPLAPFLRIGDRVAIVPAGALQRLPFAALRNRQTGRYLVQDHEIVTAPSAALFLSASARLTAAKGPLRALAAGAAGVRRADIPGLRPLRSVEPELSVLARLYPGATVLEGGSLTRERFLAAIGSYDVVHFAGHALINERYPFLSRLVMDGDGRTTGQDVSAADIASTPLARARLVVLAACRTGTGAVSSAEGVLSLARPFLVAGVPVVVGSLWDVDDRGTEALMQAFHARYARTGDAARALRGAQLALLSDRDARVSSPSTWAAFSVIGGAARQPARHEEEP